MRFQSGIIKFTELIEELKPLQGCKIKLSLYALFRLEESGELMISYGLFIS